MTSTASNTLTTRRTGTGFARLVLSVIALLLLSTWMIPQSSYGAPFNRGDSIDTRRAKKALLPPRGIIIYKMHVQADEHAPFVEYSTLNVVAKTAIDIVRHDGAGLISIPKRQLVYHVVYPQETVELASDYQIEKVRERLSRLREVADRFRQTASRMQPWIARLQHEITMWDDGFCRIDGKWVNRYELRVAELRNAFAQRRARILGSPSSPSGRPEIDERALPPMWTLDFEQQLKEEEAAMREAQKKEREKARLKRSEKFHDKVEEERPFRTDWKIKA